MERLRREMFLALILAQYLHAVVQLDGPAMITNSALRGSLSRGEAAPISHGNLLTVHFIVLVSK